METTPFDLNRSIVEWRRQFREAANLRQEVLDEMESHLRDSVATLNRQGLDPEESFLIAVRRLGSQDTLALEYAKVYPNDIRLAQAKWMLAGVLGFVLATDLSRLASSATALIGSQWNVGGLYLGWLGLIASTGLMVSIGVGFLWITFGGASRGSPSRNRFSARPAITAAMVIGGMIGFKLLAGVMPIVLTRALEPTTLGAVYSIWGWGNAVGQFILVGFAAFLFFRLASRRLISTRPLASLALALLTLAQMTSVRVDAQASSSPPANRTLSDRPKMDSVLKLWQEGKKEDALKQFSAVDFTQRPLFPKGSVLGYSEREFIALPRAVNEKLHAQILNEVRPLKALAAYVKEASLSARSRGDTAQADAYLNQLKQCGIAMEHPDSLALLQTFGKAYKRIAEEPTKPAR